MAYEIPSVKLRAAKLLCLTMRRYGMSYLSKLNVLIIKIVLNLNARDFYLLKCDDHLKKIVNLLF